MIKLKNMIIKKNNQIKWKLNLFKNNKNKLYKNNYKMNNKLILFKNKLNKKMIINNKIKHHIYNNIYKKKKI